MLSSKLTELEVFVDIKPLDPTGTKILLLVSSQISMTSLMTGRKLKMISKGEK